MKTLQICQTTQSHDFLSFQTSPIVGACFLPRLGRRDVRTCESRHTHSSASLSKNSEGFAWLSPRQLTERRPQAAWTTSASIITLPKLRLFKTDPASENYLFILIVYLIVFLCCLIVCNGQNRLIAVDIYFFIWQRRHVILRRALGLDQQNEHTFPKSAVTSVSREKRLIRFVTLIVQQESGFSDQLIIIKRHKGKHFSGLL